MRLWLWLVGILALGPTQHAVCTPTSTVEALRPSKEVAYRRGPDIFNAVHHAGRQWGSSLHHNGMSFFLVTVPEDVLLYHGSRSQETPTSPDWMAYEIEHAEVFARGRRRSNTVTHGYLHVYRTSRPKHLLYVDGTSGGTTKMGTMDSQYYILRSEEAEERERGNETFQPPSSWTDKVDESSLANDLCQLSQELNLDGILRMEAGFEIINCDFSHGLEQVQVLQRPYGGKFSPDGMLGSLEFLRGVSERYDGIGSSRVRIDYSSMVSAFFFDVNLTNPDSSRPDLPRLISAKQSELAVIRDHFVNVVRQRSNRSSGTIDWQGVSDMVVGRYADRVQFMAEGIDSTRATAKEINFLLTAFIDYSTNEPDIPASIDRCESLYLQPITPITETDHFLYAATKAVTHDICTTLFEVRELVVVNNSAGQQALDASKDILLQLMKRLNWTRFKRCPPCPLNQVCVIPMWPLGTVEEYDTPRCSNGGTDPNAVSYWGLGPRQTRPRDNGEDERPSKTGKTDDEGTWVGGERLDHLREL